MSLPRGADFRPPWPLRSGHIQTMLSSSGVRRMLLPRAAQTVMHDAEQSIEIMRQLSALGVRISVDDFGTGYSSLSYLRRLPLDKLKIDRAFIRDVVTNREDAAIVRAIVALAHNLRLKVIAEGVETPDQLAFLRELGCDQYQGYHYSVPVPNSVLVEMLRERQSRAPAPASLNLDDTRLNRVLPNV